MLYKHAIQAYKALHGEVLNLGDISNINVEDVPDHDLFTYSFPCQDISVAGKQAGIAEGTRSGLLWECERIIAAKKPKYLLMENVKNLVGKKHKVDFDKWREWLESQGYTNYWQVLNAKDYGVPQNRERVFMISILDEHKAYVFPKGFDNGIRLKDILEDEVDEKYYIGNEKAEKLISQLKDGKTGTLPGGDKVECTSALGSREHRCGGWKDTVGTLCARDYKDPKVVCLPCITPDRVEKRQNGRRFKDNDEPAFTITSQDRHGVLQVGNYREKSEGFTNPQTGRVYSVNGCSPTLNTMQGGDGQPKIIIDDTQGFDGVRLYSDYSPTIRSQRSGLKTGVDYHIRKLTPRECFRLMGLHDDEIYKIQQAGISNSQQYKLAGNSIVVDVLEHIFKELFV